MMSKDLYNQHELLEMVIIPSHALKEEEANRLIFRHLKDEDFPLRIERKRTVKATRKHRFSFERQEEHVTTKTIKNRESLESELTLSSNEIIVLQGETDWILSYYEDGLTLQGKQVSRVGTKGIADIECFLEYVITGAFPIEVSFCLDGTFGPRENVYRFMLHDADWKALIENELLPKLQIPKAKNVWQSLFFPTNNQTIEWFTGEFHPNILGNFVFAHDAHDTYYFLDHVNGDIKVF
ncbi:hypothetical protein [Exiguobacterium sp. B2(2022)]|uniref:hypothetical protein n=1 Tax=Exiguobacterium sp. B2(2022) TaxID=2992755 RepID=UPI00237B53EC|nr:hypothetical protein [Exiguobacterium sp. B2(2022)]MDE0564457.1 hypothetical protein [Exiguobacterium sp. B2(2022)]